MSMLEYAMNEFRAAGWVDENGKYTDEMQEQMCKDVLILLDVISGQGHSGFSFPYLMRLLNTLADFRPLTALTGDDSEWIELEDAGGPGMRYQNRRCSSVFKREDGTAYHSGAIVFRGKDGTYYTNHNSSIEITFPYNVPEKPGYRDDPEEDKTDG